MPRPDDYPDLATTPRNWPVPGGGGPFPNLEEPSASLKTDGWSLSDSTEGDSVPKSSNINFLFNLLNQWVQFFDIEKTANRSVVVGGDLSTNIFSRGTSFTALDFTGNPIADRFFLSSSNAVVGANVDSNRVTDTPPYELFNRFSRYAIELTNQAAIGAIPNDEDAVIVYFVEGADFIPLFRNPFTIQFAFRSSVTGTYTVVLQNSVQDMNYSTTFNISVADTWQKIVLNIPANPNSGTWDFNSGRGLTVNIVLASGTDFHGPTDVWDTTIGTNVGVDATQVNWLENIGDTLAFQFLKIEEGAVATPLENTSVAEDIVKQHRYYQKSYNNFDAPGVVTNNGRVRYHSGASAPTLSEFLSFRESLRENGIGFNATAQIYSPVTGAAGFARNITQNVDVAVASIGIYENGLEFTTVAGPVAGDVIEYHYTAESELL